MDVFVAIGENRVIDESKYPFVYKWFNAMRCKSAMDFMQMKPGKSFRIFTPKLKLKS